MGRTIVISGKIRNEERVRIITEQLKVLLQTLTGEDVHVNVQISKAPKK